MTVFMMLQQLGSEFIVVHDTDKQIDSEHFQVLCNVKWVNCVNRVKSVAELEYITVLVPDQSLRSSTVWPEVRAAVSFCGVWQDSNMAGLAT